MPITKDQIISIMDSATDDTNRRKKQRDYFKGKHSILENPETNKDGSAKVQVVHNLVKRCVQGHVGFALAEPIKILPQGTDDEQDEETVVEGGEKTSGFDLYEELRDENDLDAIDADHYRDAIVEDVSYEIISFDRKLAVEEDPVDRDVRIRITKIPGCECVGVFDSSNELHVLIREVPVKAGTYWEGELVLNDRTEVWVYEREATTVYTKTEEADPQTNTVKIDLTQKQSEPNPFDELLVVPFMVDKRREPYISETLIALQDHYNRLLSEQGNSIIQNTKENWVVKGYTGDPGNEQKFQEMLKNRVIFVKEDGSVERQKIGADVAEIQDNRQATRSAIFETGGVADTSEIVGATGGTSGIALRLAMTPQKETADPMIRTFKRSVRKRIELINRIHAVLDRPAIEDYSVQMTTKTIVNETELWAGITQLLEVLSREDAIGIAVPSIEDPKAANERKQKELEQELERDIMLKEAEPTGPNVPVGAQAAVRQGRRIRTEADTEANLGAQFDSIQSGLSDEDAERVAEEAVKLGIGS